ncbi:methyl-accepting chemotaxis protein [Propionispora hippei]|uniref:Methyl-accepting chemotaxis protein n=1 Tax=Propionispora hippei DSM 15287 TaxID=1123003 RepID=A0A1M6F5I4_9FIRM|nr:methyl-accepting chemotaxis protein [Propionispora hippei]SHI92978.1 methyl-accepting chemotaxis protein [Propionispora hippei DSM 15287]
MKVKNMQNRLLIMLLPLVLVGLSILAGVSYYLSAGALRDSVDQTAKAVGTDYANQIQGDVRLMMAQLADLASVQRVRSGADKGQIVAAMAEAKNRLGAFDAVVFIFPDGTGINSEGNTANYGERDYFRKVKASQDAAVSDPLVSKTTGKLSVVLAVPVIYNNQLTGVLVGTVSVERLTAKIKDLTFLDSGYGQISDDSGLIIAHPKRPDLAGKLSLREKKINSELKLQQDELDDRLIQLFKAAADEGKQARGVYSFVDGVTRIAVTTPVDLPGEQRWVVTVAAPEVEATRQSAALAKAMLIISIISLLVVGSFIVLIARQLARPIAIIRDECLLLAQGDLRDREARVRTEDEIGQLAQGFRQMRDNLRALVMKIHSQSDQLAASSEQLTAGAGQSALAVNQVADSITTVAAGSSEQMTAVRETVQVVEQMSDHIQKLAEDTVTVAAQSAQAASQANDGDAAVSRAIEQMNQIEETVTGSARLVTELGERSKEIGQIVATISGIAGQTNLLALNAAIEAARAGEQGRGFAVVAEEVRKLAEQSQLATEQIAALINSIQTETDEAVTAMNNGTKEVKLGAEVVDAAGQAFREIVALINQVSGQVEGFSVAIGQLTQGSQQIVESVSQIENLSRKTAGEAQTVSAASEEQSASMEEIASSSQSLANLATELRDSVSKFQV